MSRPLRLALLAGLVVVLVAVLLVLRSTGGAEEEEPAFTTEPDSERVALFEFPEDSIERIDFANDNGEISIVNEGEQFSPRYPHEVRFDQSSIRRIVSSATSLYSRRIIDAAPSDLGTYGLDEPRATVTVVASGASPATLLLGDETPARDSIYVKLATESTVYSVYSSWLDPFLFSMDDLRDKSLPGLNFQELRSVAIDTIDGRRLRIDPLPEGQSDPEMSFASHVVTEPFRRKLGASSSFLETLAESYAALSIPRFVDDRPSALATYGLATPAGRFQASDAASSVELLVGGPAEGGRYAKLGNEQPVFILRGADALINVDPAGAVSGFVLIVNIDLVDRFVVETGTETFTGTISREPAASEDEDPVETYRLNGEAIEEDPFRDLYQAVIGLLVDAEASQPPRGAAEVSVTLFLSDGTSRRASFAPYDQNYYAVIRDGVSEFVIARSKVNRMVGALQAALTS